MEHAYTGFTNISVNPLNAELNPICHLLALLGGATIVVVSRLRVKEIPCYSLGTDREIEHEILKFRTHYKSSKFTRNQSDWLGKLE